MTADLRHGWVLEQTARAKPHAIEHLESRWSPAQLLTDCEPRRRIVRRHEPIVIHELDSRITCRCCGYGSDWPAAWPRHTFRDAASVYATRPDYPAESRT